MAKARRARFFAAPEGYVEAVLPAGVELAERDCDFVQAFVRSRGDVEQLAEEVLAALAPRGVMWWCYPRAPGNQKPDINRDRGWEPLRERGYRPVTQIAVDDEWSALRFRPEGEVGT